MSQDTGYLNQYERVKRFYEHFRQFNDGLPIPQEGPYKINDLDEIYAFFIFCYHLKDWIKNDVSIDESTRNKVEAYINKNNCLIVCGDLCNGLKHLTRNPNQMRSREQPEFESKKVTVKFKGDKQPILGVKFFVSTDAGTKDAFELATECLETWERFIKQNI